MPAGSGVSVSIRSDVEGSWVLWRKHEASGILGPYSDHIVAENVRGAKEWELVSNEDRIDDASPFRA